MVVARPEGWNGVTRSCDLPAAHPVSRHGHTPHASYATKRPGTAGQNHINKLHGIMKKRYSRRGRAQRPIRCSVNPFDGLSNVSMNWCTSNHHLKMLLCGASKVKPWFPESIMNPKKAQFPSYMKKTQDWDS